MHTKVELPKAFSVRDEHEFLPDSALDGAAESRSSWSSKWRRACMWTAAEPSFWGLVYLNGEPPSKKKVENALREAGFDFVHNVLTQAATVWTDHSDEKRNGIAQCPTTRL